MADFGGWDMPIEYPADAGGGVLNEHQAVRERVGLFDVSHLGKVEVKGAGALGFLNAELTNDLNRISDGQAQYTLLCDEATGGVVDDLIAYRRTADDFLLVPNAANTAEVVRRLEAANPNRIEIKNCHSDFAIFALQGPKSRDVLSSLGVVETLDYMEFTTARIDGCEMILCRTGYTGELGFELVATWSDAIRIWSALEAKVISRGGLVAGLGARDTLRTEMGYPLHGHELSLEITPVQAGATWAVGWKKGDFSGRAVLDQERMAGPKRILRGLKLLDRGVPRADMKVLKDGSEVGFLTSGTFSPTLKIGIGLGFIDPQIEIGSRVEVDIRGKAVIAEVTKPPFLPSHVR
jgi:aminomethyltransferase